MDKRIKYIDGVKGFSSVKILLFHLILIFYPATRFIDEETAYGIGIDAQKLWGGWPSNWIFNGSFSVYPFWTISGFLLTKSFYSYIRQNITIKKLFSRLIRLVSIVLIGLLEGYALTLLNLPYNKNISSDLLFTNSWLPIVMTDSKSFSLLLKGFSHTLLDVQNPYNYYNAPLWTMNIELIGTLAVLFYCLLTSDRKNKNKNFLIWLLLAFFALKIPGLLCFFSGVLLYEISKNNNERLVFAIISLCLGAFLGGVPLYIISSLKIYNLLSTKVDYCYMLGGFFIILAFLNSSFFRKIFSNNVLTFLGEISDWIYAIHFPILMTFSCRVFCMFYNYYTYNFSFALTSLLTILLVIVLALFCKRYMNKIIVLNTAMLENVYKKFCVHFKVKSNESNRLYN